MKRRFIALTAALMAVVMVPAIGVAQGKKKAAAPAVSEAQRKQGMAEAPAFAQQLGLVCQVSDARFVGKSEDKKAKTSMSYYEVDCAQGVGYVIEAPSAGTPRSFSCIEANTPLPDGKPPSLPCLLPGNADPKADVAPLLQKAKIQCTPTNIRGIGQSPTQTYFEVACQEGPGYVVIASAPLDPAKDVKAENCLSFDDTDSNVKCTLSDKAARLAVVDSYAVAAKNNCVVKDRRYIGASVDGSSYYESSCQDGKGYIYKIAGGQMTQNWDCAKAQMILGGCTLTDAREAATEQAGLYTRLAKSAGSSCDVDKYAIFPTTGSKEVVELVCKDGKGGIGMFETGKTGLVLDCGRALAAGYKCGMNKAGAGNEELTADLRKFDQKSCVVSNARLAAKTQKGNTLVEVACSDGYKGYMIEYDANNYTAVSATGCAFAAGCKLPGNT